MRQSCAIERLRRNIEAISSVSNAIGTANRESLWLMNSNRIGFVNSKATGQVAEADSCRSKCALCGRIRGFRQIGRIPGAGAGVENNAESLTHDLHR